jgi:hypothetical protein
MQERSERIYSQIKDLFIIKRERRNVMKRVMMIMIFTISLIASYGYAEREGHMMGSGMMGSPGYGEEAKEYGQSMMGYGGHGMMGGGMMGYGMGPCMMGGGMMGQGMMGHHQMMHGTMGQGMMGGMMGPGMMQGYDAEEYQKYLDDTRELRRKMHGKKFEYSEALRNTETKPETMKRLQKEMWEIQKKIYDRALE